MRLLVMSHPCVTATNQQFFADVESATGWAITLVVPGNWRTEYGPIRQVSRWPAFRGTIIPVPVALPGRIPQHVYLGSLARVLRQERPDAIYAHHEPYALATAQLWAANRMSVRAAFGFYSAQNLLRRYPWPIPALERQVHRSSSFAFPLSQAVLDVLRARGYRGPAHVLPLGVDPAFHHPADGTGLRLRLGLHGFVFGFVGRLVPEKGLTNLFQAFAMLGQPDTHLLMVGEGPMRTELQQLARELGIAGQIRWVGYVPHADVAEYYAAMDAVVLPSETRPGRKEQFGRVVIEALACGRPIIGSDVGEIPVLIRETGGGVIFPEGDALALTQAMGHLLTSPALGHRLAEAGARVVAERYTNPAIARTFALHVQAGVSGTLQQRQVSEQRW